MKRFFKNKFFYITVTVALLLVIVPTVLLSMGKTFFLRDAVTVIFKPVEKLFSSVTDSLEGFSAYFYKFDELAAENEALKQKLAEYEQEVYDAREIEDTYVWMSDFLELKMVHTDFTFTAAEVIARSGDNLSDRLTLNVGSSSGIEIGMPVVTADGVIGQITEVDLTSSKVSTILEVNSSVGAFIESTAESGVCTGRFSLADDGLTALEYIPEGSLVAVGDRVVTSGRGSVYPRGLVIGYVTEVSANSYSRTTDVTVRCAADMHANKVMVITSFDTHATDAADAVE